MIYIRVKRKKQTIFLHCEPTDTILSLKQKISAINRVAPEAQRFLNAEVGTTMDNNKTVNECKLENASVVHLVYRIDPPEDDPTKREEWEPVDLHDPLAEAAAASEA